MSKKGCALVFFLFFFFADKCFSLDEQVTDKYQATKSQSAVKMDRAMRKTPPTTKKSPLKIKVSVDAKQGYDNNVDLDSQRHADGFFQNITDLDAVYTVNKKVKLKAGIEIFDTIYYKYNVDNLLDVVPYVGFEWEIIPGVKWINKCVYDYFDFPNKKQNTYSGLEVRTYLRHQISKKIYHEVGYEHQNRWYVNNPTVGSDLRTTSENRADERNLIKYSVGTFWGKKFMLKLSNELYRNDSNYEYQEYYDYWVYALRPFAMYFFTDKFYTSGGFAYKYRDYKDRRSSEDINKKTSENTFLYNAGFYYDLTKNLTLEFMYSYSENDPSDPYYKYSGSVVSGGVYYTF